MTATAEKSEGLKRTERACAIEQDLRQFYGTSQYYRNGPLTFTDGIHYLAEKAECYWLLDIVASYLPDWVAKAPFQLWRLIVNSDSSAVITMQEDDGAPELVRQEIPYTDFCFNKFEFYVCDGIALIKSEY